MRPASGSAFPIGTATVTCSATDVAGNTSNAMFDVRIVDDEDPVTANPGDRAQQLETGSSGATSFAPATATDNSGSVTVACDPELGDIVDAGTITVTCRAVDPAGNSSLTSFDMVVSAAQPDGQLPATDGGDVFLCGGRC